MDKEMLEKVNEFMKANGRRELNMEEADQVVGGIVLPGPEENTVLIDGVVVDCYDFNTGYQALVSAFGFDIAYDMFRVNTGFDIYEGSKSSKSDHDKMDAILNAFWKTIGRLQNNDHAF